MLDGDSGSNVARYSFTQNIDEPMAMLRSSATSYYNADGLGTITSLANASGSLAQIYTFDCFGNQTASSSSIANSFQYSARESDPETGLYFYRARYYDSNIGRFFEEDPLRAGAGTSDYSYVENSPIRRTDPTGLHSVFFDGNMVRVFDDNGNLLLACRGTSGVSGSTPNDQKHEFGPIPKGYYLMDPTEFSGGWLRSYFRGGAWGTWRIPLHPLAGTDTLGRHATVHPGEDPFFIHGSDHNGSAGCINIGKCDVRFHNLLANHAGPILVHTNYTQFRPF